VHLRRVILTGVGETIFFAGGDLTQRRTVTRVSIARFAMTEATVGITPGDDHTT
jgi:enoyl-CoA hydratase/carnithine racemase